MKQNDFTAQIDDAIKAHSAMKRALTLAVSLNDSSKSPAEIACDDKCAFGRWLKSPLMSADIRAGKPYQVISRLHTDFHRTAGDVARLGQRGNQLEAFALLDGAYSEKSSTLTRALQKWRAQVSA